MSFSDLNPSIDPSFSYKSRRFGESISQEIDSAFWKQQFYNPTYKAQLPTEPNPEKSNPFRKSGYLKSRHEFEQFYPEKFNSKTQHSVKLPYFNQIIQQDKFDIDDKGEGYMKPVAPGDYRFLQNAENHGFLSKHHRIIKSRNF